MTSTSIRILALAGICSLAATGLSAQTVVSETPDGDLRVVDYSGKPPFERRIIRAEDSADFARFEALEDTVMVATGTSRRGGPAGKSLPAQWARVERVNEADISQFARFEETDAAGSSRMWRGAPGKGRALTGK